MPQAGCVSHQLLASQYHRDSREKEVTTIMAAHRVILAGFVQAILCVTAFSAPEAKPRDWPCWRGPFGNGTTRSCGQSLVDDVRKARKVWVTEDSIPQANNPTPDWPNGGYCSPIVSDGRVYMFYFITAQRRHQIRLPDEPEPKHQEHEYAVVADEVLQCFDAATGRTLWKTVHRGTGINYYRGKCGAHMVPAVADGKVYALGTTGKIYCMDAATGEPLWTSHVASIKHHSLERMAIDGRIEKFDWTAYCTLPLVAGDAVICGDGDGRYVAHDADTGRFLWRSVRGLSSWTTVPVRWMHDGVPRVVVHTAKFVQCLDPASGKTLWRVDVGMDGGHRFAAVSGDYLVGIDSGKLRCLEMSPEGAETAWTVDLRREGLDSKSAAVVIHRDTVHLIGAKQARFELASGERLDGVATAPPPSYGWPAATDDHVVWATDDGLYMLLSDVFDYRTVGEEPLPVQRDAGTSIALADGRVYVRGSRNVTCYDIRRNPPAPARRVNAPGPTKPRDLVKALESPFLRDRQRAARLLKEAGEPTLREMGPALVALVETGTWPVQSVAMDVLAERRPCAGSLAAASCLWPSR